MNNKIVIVGAGHAGGILCSNLRRQGFNGEITIIGEEPFHPYARPELSKGLLKNIVDENRIYLKNEDFYKRNNINIITNSIVCSIKRNEQKILTDSDKEISYDYLVLATGSKVKEIKSSCNQKKLLYLRTLSDSKNIKKLLDRRNTNLGIIGSGYIGLEVASVASENNHTVSLFDTEKRVMKRSTCPEISKFIKSKHEKNGVNFFLGAKIIDIEDHQSFKKIILNNGSEITVDEVIVGVGVEPRIMLALEAGLECNNGIVINEDCITTDPNILAIGDCTYAMNELYNEYLRIESVHNAVKQSKIASAYLTGNVRPKYEVPWFWSNQYDLKILFTGISNNYDEKIIRGSIEKESFSVGYLKNNQLIALDSINRNKDYIQSKKIIGKRSIIDRNLLANKDNSLKNIFI